MAKNKAGAKPEAPKKEGKYVELYDVNEKIVKVPASDVEHWIAIGYRKELPKK